MIVMRLCPRTGGYLRRYRRSLCVGEKPRHIHSSGSNCPQLAASHPVCRHRAGRLPRRLPRPAAVDSSVELDRLITFDTSAASSRPHRCLDVIAFTSTTLFETFGIVNLEAMAMRVPVVHFGTAGMQVTHGGRRRHCTFASSRERVKRCQHVTVSGLLH